jgi:signal transduction histidine kinase
MILLSVEGITEPGQAKTPALEGVQISVGDSGCGIPIQNIDRIFEPFFTSKGAHGTGLGLWIARTIVQRLGGSIRVRSCASREEWHSFFGFPAQPTAKLDLTSSRWNQGRRVHNRAN